jgi:hypothetical protein
MKTIIPLFLLLFLAASCDLDGYGPSVTTNNVEVYYKPDGVKDQAKNFSVMLDTLGYGTDGMVSFQIIKDSLIHINMVTQDQYHTDKSMDYSLNAISLLSSMEVFKEDDVQLHLCDDSFNRVRSLEKVRN